MICFSREKAPLPIEFLSLPAQLVLKEVLRLRMNSATSEISSLEHLNGDATLVLQACKALQRSRAEDNANIDDEILSATAKSLVASLNYTTALLSTLILWHFDASICAPSRGLTSLRIPEGLTRFLRQPDDSAVWHSLHDRYNSNMQTTVSFDDFKKMHDFLLFPVLGSLSNGI